MARGKHKGLMIKGGTAHGHKKGRKGGRKRRGKRGRK